MSDARYFVISPWFLWHGLVPHLLAERERTSATTGRDKREEGRSEKGNFPKPYMSSESPLFHPFISILDPCRS